MGRLTFAVLLLALGLVARVSASNADAGLKVPAGIAYATTAQNWTQTISNTLTGGTQAKVTLTPCPTGIDTTSGAGYQVFISGGGKSEAVKVISGSCVSGAPSGTITFTPYYSYPVGSTIGSASSGIQETINAACGVYPATNPGYNAQCNVTIPANGPYLGSGGLWSLNNYNVYGTIFFHSNQSSLDGRGTTMNCLGRGPCLQVGDRISSNDYVNNVVSGLSFRAPTNFNTAPYNGSVITTTAVGATGLSSPAPTNAALITTAAAHGFRPGDMATILFTDAPNYWGDTSPIYDCGTSLTAAYTACTGSSTTFRYPRTGTIASQTTPGVVALAYSAILDDAEGTQMTNIHYDVSGDEGRFNNFFDLWDDENATIDHFMATAIGLSKSATWMGSFVFAGGGYNLGSLYQGTVAPVITLRDSNISAAASSGVTDYASNGLYIENTVIQGQGLWQVYSSNVAGNYQGAYLKNIYSEYNAAFNPVSSPYTPFGGTGLGGLIVGPSSNVATVQIEGTGTEGVFPTGGSGTAAYYSYFIVANCVGTGTKPSCPTTPGSSTSPMQILNWASTGSDSPVVRWPRIANGTDTITYDVIRMTTPSGIGSVFPNVGNCLGGSGGTCGYVAQGISQATACAGGLVCTYTDTGVPATVGHSGTPGNYPAIGSYLGNFSFWPGALVSLSSTVKVDVEESPVVGIGLYGSPIQTASVCGENTQSGGGGVVGAGGYTNCLATTMAQTQAQPATILADGSSSGGGYSGVPKGRLNFTTSPFGSIEPHHIITLIDSQPGLTQSTLGLRPPASANDVWIGTDVPAGGVGLNAGQLAFGAPVSITNYIGGTGGSAHPNWLERLTSKQKTFAVPVRISDGNSLTLGDGSPLSQMKIYSVNNIPASHVPPQSCVDVVGGAKGLTKSDQITRITPPGRLGNLSLSAYPADEGAINLHFCNPSGSEVTTPPGAYSFLAVR